MESKITACQSHWSVQSCAAQLSLTVAKSALQRAQLYRVRHEENLLEKSGAGATRI